MRTPIGIDAAKGTHRAVAIDPGAVDGLASALRSLGDEVVIGLDVGGACARFPEAVPLAGGFAPVHAARIAATRAGQRFAGGERMSDPRHARIVADLVRARDLRPILPDDDTRGALRLEVGRRRGPVRDRTRRISRPRGLLRGIHPGLGRPLDLPGEGPLALRARHVTPAGIRRAGKSRLRAHLEETLHLRGAEAPADRALEAARAQGIVVPGEAPTAGPTRDRAPSPMSRGPLAQHGRPLEAGARIARDLGGLPADHPDGALTRSLPGRGAVRAAEFVACLGDVRRRARGGARALVARARRRVAAIRTILRRRDPLHPARNAACPAHHAASPIAACSASEAARHCAA
jgi:hypothetical protein